MSAFGYVFTYAANLPAYDEWQFAPALFAEPAQQWTWIWAPHAEHRYPLGRMAYLAVFHSAGGDFRAGQYAAVALFAAAAAFLLLAIRKLRGRLSYADSLIPILFLHRGHYENWLIGYQVVFALTVLAVAVFAWIASISKEWNRPQIGWAALAILPLPALGGGTGLLFYAPLVPWFLMRLFFRRSGPLSVGGWLGLATISGTFAYAVWSFFDLASSPVTKPPLSTAMFGSFLQNLGLAAGPALAEPHHIVGIFILAVGLPVAIAKLLVLRRDPNWIAKLGAFAILAGAFLFLLAVTISRPAQITVRYAAFAALVPLVRYLVGTDAVTYPRWYSISLTLFVAIAGILIIRQNWIGASGYGSNHRDAEVRIAEDVREGMPLDLLIEKHVYAASDSPGSVRAAWETLWNRGLGPIRGATAPIPNLRERASANPPKLVATADLRLLPLDPFVNRYELGEGGSDFVHAIRIDFAVKPTKPWQVLRLHWIARGADGRETLHQSSVSPWFVSPKQSTVFWLNSEISAAWLEVGRDEPTPEPLRVIWLVDSR